MRFPSAIESVYRYYQQNNIDTAGGLFLYATTVIVFFIPLIIFIIESGWFLRSSELLPPPTEITQLIVYPIKSCRGVRLKNARLLKTGLNLDRKWMFVDKNMEFVTIRDNSQMTLINTAITKSDELVVDATSLESSAKFQIALYPTQEWLEKNTELKKVRIWKVITDGWIYPAELTTGISKIFGEEIRLCLKGPEPRSLGGNAAAQYLKRVESTLFPDVMPLQVANEKSIQQVNEWLKEKGADLIDIERFRPNVVVAGHEPWYEDSWKTLRFGNQKGATVDVTARCGRCLVPNVDPETGVADKKQPWDVMMKHRRVDEGLPYKPCFGMLCAPRDEADLYIGMPVYIKELTSSHRYISGM